VSYIKRNFFGDFVSGIVLILIIMAMGTSEVKTYFLNKITMESTLINGSIALFGMSAEILLFKAIELGVTGPCIAIVGFNSILVTFTSMLLNGRTISIGQSLCIFMSFLGVIAIANGRQ
jgi:uncharacterized membrane protein